MVWVHCPIRLHFLSSPAYPGLHWTLSLPSQHWPHTTFASHRAHLRLTSLDLSACGDPLISFLIALGGVLYLVSIALALKEELCGKRAQKRLRPKPIHN